MKNILLFNLPLSVRQGFQLLVLGLGLQLGATLVWAQDTVFTYQGQLKTSGAPANGAHDFEFKLFDAATGGTQLGANTLSNVTVTNGVFTVPLNFGAVFGGEARYLEISARQTGAGAFTPLTPRQLLTATPYALRSATATNALQLGGLPSTQYAQTNDARLSDERNPKAGSANYIQNTTTQQANANFNISGNGVADGKLEAGVVNALTQYNLRGSRILTFNAAGDSLYVGSEAGNLTTTARLNTFVGNGAGTANSTGTGNTYLGDSAGRITTIGYGNSFFGLLAGEQNTTGVYNTFVGLYAGRNNTLGNQNTILGGDANVLNAELNNATAIGNRAAVGTSNALVLGSINGVNGATASTNVGIGTPTPQARLHLRDNNGNILLGNGGCNAGFAGLGFAAALNCSNYSLLGNGTDTILNRPTGGSISFRENNATQMTLQPGGLLALNTLGAGGATQLCRNASNQISTCSSSLRYKNNIAPFASGLSLVQRLQPITFDWKEGGLHDLGLGAEDVAAISELLVIRNDKGEVEGVKYDRIGVVLLNAVKEQQAQIAEQAALLKAQQAMLQRQQAQIAALQKLSPARRQSQTQH